MTARQQAPWRRLARQLRAPEPGAACGRCLDELPLFVSDEVAGRAVDDVYPAVAEHLDLCPDCLQAYVTLSRLLQEALSEAGIGE